MCPISPARRLRRGSATGPSWPILKTTSDLNSQRLGLDPAQVTQAPLPQSYSFPGPHTLCHAQVGLKAPEPHSFGYPIFPPAQQYQPGPPATDEDPQLREGRQLSEDTQQGKWWPC